MLPEILSPEIQLSKGPSHPVEIHTCFRSLADNQSEQGGILAASRV